MRNLLSSQVAMDFLVLNLLHGFAMFYLFVFGATTPQWARGSSFTRFLDHIQRRTTVGRTPLDEISARRRDLCLTTHNTHNKQISMPRVGFETTISAGDRPKTYALDRAATGTGTLSHVDKYKITFKLVINHWTNEIL